MVFADFKQLKEIIELCMKLKMDSSSNYYNNSIIVQYEEHANANQIIFRNNSCTSMIINIYESDYYTEHDLTMYESFPKVILDERDENNLGLDFDSICGMNDVIVFNSLLNELLINIDISNEEIFSLKTLYNYNSLNFNRESFGEMLNFAYSLSTNNICSRVKLELCFNYLNEDIIVYFRNSLLDIIERQNGKL